MRGSTGADKDTPTKCFAIRCPHAIGNSCRYLRCVVRVALIQSAPDTLSRHLTVKAYNSHGNSEVNDANIQVKHRLRIIRRVPSKQICVHTTFIGDPRLQDPSETARLKTARQNQTTASGKHARKKDPQHQTQRTC